MSAIKAGDLVMVVKRRPCGCAGKLGATFRVAMVRLTDPVRCIYCGAVMPAALSAQTPDGKFCYTSRLLKIDPPKEPLTRGTEAEHE